MIILVLVTALTGCKFRFLEKPDSSQLNLNSVGDISECSLLDDEGLRGDCQKIEVMLAESESPTYYSDIGSDHIYRFLGEPMVIVSNGRCFSKTGKSVSFASCKDYDMHLKWHLVDVEVQYEWNGNIHWGRAFQMVSRESVRKWAQSEVGKAPALECVDFDDIDSDKENYNNTYKLALKPCRDARFMFLTIPNDMLGDENLYQKFHWSRFIGIDLNEPKFANLRKSQKRFNPYLTENTVAGGLSQVPLQNTEEDRVHLGDFTWAHGTYVLNFSKFDFVEKKRELGFPVLIPAVQ